MRKEDTPLDKSGECGRFDCERKQYKLTKNFRPHFGVCKRHYFQYDYTDPAIKKIKKYWLLGFIAVGIIGVLQYFK